MSSRRLRSLMFLGVSVCTWSTMYHTFLCINLSAISKPFSTQFFIDEYLIIMLKKILFKKYQINFFLSLNSLSNMKCWRNSPFKENCVILLIYFRKHFDLSIQPLSCIYYDGMMKSYCSKACQNVSVMMNRKIIPCGHCKVDHV